MMKLACETCEDVENLASCALVIQEHSNVDFSFYFSRGAFIYHKYMIIIINLILLGFLGLINVTTIFLDALQCLALHFVQA